ncbi:MAG: hypothetical protein DRQ55_20090 [Planctomycetota bacterium]|nr:MAG: hypothetical protein DRQ55_20090 [Planctomycetota bacterium]
MPGGQVIIEMGGAAGDLAQIQVARLPALVPFAGSLLPRQVDIGRTASVGVIPPSGTRAVPLRMAAWQRGYVLFLQAATVGPAGTELSSSAALIIR